MMKSRSIRSVWSLSSIINWTFYVFSFVLIVFVGVWLIKGIESLLNSYIPFSVLFFIWWMVLFVKVKQDYKNGSEIIRSLNKKISIRF